MVESSSTGSAARPLNAYRLSPLQAGMLFHYIQRGRASGVDIEQLEAMLPEPLDIGAFTAAWRTVAAQHEVLRTRFRWEDGQAPLQEVVAASSEVPVVVRDIAQLDPAAQTAHLAAFLRDDRREGFDLAVAPLWRVTVFRLSDAEYRMVWTYSHAILDSCYADVLREVFETYDAIRRGVAPTLAQRKAYSEYIAWLQQHVIDSRDAAQAFWRERLAGVAAPTSIEAIMVPPERRTEVPGHDTVHFQIDRSASDAIRAQCTQSDLRVSTFIEAVWALVLAAFSGDQEVIFGTTREGRRSSMPGADRVIGLVINTIPVRVAVPPELPLRSLLLDLRAGQVAVRPFEQTPLVDIAATAGIQQGSALFDTIIVFNDQIDDTRLRGFGGDFERRRFTLHDQTNFAIAVMAYNEPEITFKLSFDRGRFGRDVLERMADLMTQLLEAMAKRPDATIGGLPRLPRQDQARAAAFNDTTLSIAQPQCVHHAFEAQVDRTPDQVAIVFRGQTLTYRELDERANRVAAELVACGVGSDRLVGIFVERSIEMVVGLLAILKAGGAYVPMDPAYPRERISMMLEDSQAMAVLTLARLRDRLPPTRSPVIPIDAFSAERRVERIGSAVRPQHLAYVIFTSGSTGRPKGVQIEHLQVANFFAAMDLALGTTPGVWLALTSISFDISVLEIFWTLARGFKVVIQEEAERAMAAARPGTASRRHMGFSLFYFAADAGGDAGSRYRLLIEGAKFADAHGFEAVWTPERHFHPFGGLYPNPAVTGAAVAAVTSRIAIRAGSVVLPLHNPIRCAEEWSVVDNLSNGRVGLSFASGWHANDFALAPANFKDRRAILARSIDTVCALWRGDAVEAKSGDGSTIEVRIYPPPVQRRPGIWITASGNPETFATAGRMGAFILTNLLVMTPEELRSNLAVYREAYREAGHSGEGHVTLMLHAFIGADLAEVRAKVREPFLQYLRISTDLINKAQWERTAFAKADDRSSAKGTSMNLDDLSPEDRNAILDHAFERYFSSVGLFGTPDTCMPMVDRLSQLGVDEIACLIDFGVAADDVLAGLTRLDELRGRWAHGEEVDIVDYGLAAQIRRHQVTHMQCTPSLLGLLLLDEDAAGAIGTLRQLLVGGEALSDALVERLRPHFPNMLRNMYGPTETTIWSTTTAVTPGTQVTIGRPIANTTIRFTDQARRPVPIGVPGELLIGGGGVARGYLNRPELTAERFVTDPATGERMYRTGDLARWLPSGEIEFLGRLDNQVKIRGYRIELGEIEAAIAGFPDVRECAVVVRETGAEAKLVAYVVPWAGRRSAEDAGRATDQWTTVWGHAYDDAAPVPSDLDTAGWTSSFTGEPIAEAEMREWVESTVARLRAIVGGLSHRPRVLEIGCGTGMLLTRLAPDCAEYVAIDPVEAALNRVRRRVESDAIANVTLQRLAAHELAELSAGGSFDLIILNSVIQYFPGSEYLAEVLSTAYALLADGGTLFVGDVRGLEQANAFYAAVEIARSAPGSSASDFAARVRRRVAEEPELLVAPPFFDKLAMSLPNAVFIGAEAKVGREANEMICYRYDVTVRRGPVGSLIDSPLPVQAPSPSTLDALRAMLVGQSALRVINLVNARTAKDAWLARRVLDGAVSGSLEQLAAAVPVTDAVHPDDLRTLHPDYVAFVELSAHRADALDVTFVRRTGTTLPVVRRPAGEASAPLATWTNRPASRATPSALVPDLRDFCRSKLPAFMVPIDFVLLEALPLTPNGKIDRKGLPAPEPRRVDATAAPPATELERTVIRVLEELVAGPVGVDDNFFDAGINSLLMVQASIRLRSLLSRPVPLVEMFQYPSARALAAALGRSGSENTRDKSAAATSRASQRRHAMGRRRAIQAGH